MILTITLLAVLLLGYELSLRMWQELASAERVTYAITIGTLIWLASTWALALASLLRREALIARTIALLVVALLLLARRWSALRKAFETTYDQRMVIVYVAALFPLVLWISYALWRGALLPPLNHDALAYHLTKAALYVREQGFGMLDALRFFLPARASNYELLIADAMAADGSDRFTEWPSVVFYVGFVAGGVAIAQRWWRIGAMATAATALLLAGVPVLLLHSAAHKNDLMLAFLAVAAFVAVGRALSTDDTAALALAVACFGAGAGTKNHGAVIALAFAPIVAWCLFRRFDRRRFAIVLAVAVLSVVLLGSIDQIAKLTRHGNRVPNAADRVGVPRYGDWNNLWQGPYALIAAPLSSSAFALSVPWESRPWFWRRYELFFSHFGVVFSAAALAMPVMLVAMWRRRDDRRLERLAVTAATLVAFFLLLPVVYSPAGLYLIYLPRFVLFLVPVVFAWSVPLLFERVAAMGERWAVAALLGSAAVFAIYAVDNAVDDTFAPIDYVFWVRQHPGTRSTAFDPNRSELIVDRIAGPRDTILIDPGYGAWVYPAYGRNLTRDVRFVPPGKGKPVFADDVDWIVVDRGWSAAWANPDFKRLSQASKYLSRPKPKPEDSRVLNAAASDPRFELVHVHPPSMQAIFRRRQPDSARK